ncbi:Uncharacterised protein [Mycobacteroides abscessus subsp. massiliense]|nr:Uncharacterised protein [Mycobacteroides abscessus subsp. massiliense]SKK28828.1 Uncharacterised protein [Mycobacteroides abscessus subsp. massiliense]SKK51359.1 Uncharacterised protein [Mycobacteroides abscessus subsp. massiliense]
MTMVEPSAEGRADPAGINVDQGLDVVEIEIARRQPTAVGIGYHAGTGLGKTDLDLRDDSA